jgi:hypothetical protein
MSLPVFEQCRRVRFDDPKGSYDLRRPESRHGAHGLRPTVHCELNYRLTSGCLNMHVGRAMLPRWEEDGDAKPVDSQNRGHRHILTQQIGYCKPIDGGESVLLRL